MIFIILFLLLPSSCLAFLQEAGKEAVSLAESTKKAAKTSEERRPISASIAEQIRTKEKALEEKLNFFYGNFPKIDPGTKNEFFIGLAVQGESFRASFFTTLEKYDPAFRSFIYTELEPAIRDYRNILNQSGMNTNEAFKQFFDTSRVRLAQAVKTSVPKKQSERLQKSSKNAVAEEKQTILKRLGPLDFIAWIETNLDRGNQLFSQEQRKITSERSKNNFFISSLQQDLLRTRNPEIQKQIMQETSLLNAKNKYLDSETASLERWNQQFETFKKRYQDFSVKRQQVKNKQEYEKLLKKVKLESIKDFEKLAQARDAYIRQQLKAPLKVITRDIPLINDVNKKIQSLIAQEAEYSLEADYADKAFYEVTEKRDLNRPPSSQEVAKSQQIWDKLISISDAVNTMRNNISKLIILKDELEEIGLYQISHYNAIKELGAIDAINPKDLDSFEKSQLESEAAQLRQRVNQYQEIIRERYNQVDQVLAGIP